MRMEWADGLSFRRPDLNSFKWPLRVAYSGPGLLTMDKKMGNAWNFPSCALSHSDLGYKSTRERRVHVLGVKDFPCRFFALSLSLFADIIYCVMALVKQDIADLQRNLKTLSNFFPY